MGKVNHSTTKAKWKHLYCSPAEIAAFLRLICRTALPEILAEPSKAMDG
ncbi:MAG: hypothetical protein LBP78_07660 [Acidaminococcales bacterium]|jgi:hypothetical protein|nr:hypothetical protein [Acidaminococcales bacterium]